MRTTYSMRPELGDGRTEAAVYALVAPAPCDQLSFLPRFQLLFTRRLLLQFSGRLTFFLPISFSLFDCFFHLSLLFLFFFFLSLCFIWASFFFLLASLSIMFYFLFLCGNDEAYVYSFHCRSPRSIIFPFVKEIHDRGPRK